MSEVKWVKITTDMFDNRKIKYLRKLPEGNNICLIWVMLLTMAGRCNTNGLIFLTENIPYTPKILADELGFEEMTVELALNQLMQLNMIEDIDGHIAIAGWEEYQNIEGMDKVREQNRLRKQKQRENEKLLTDSCHVTSRDSHATDKDKEKEYMLFANANNVELLDDVSPETEEASPESAETSPEPEKDNSSEQIEEIVNYLNEKSGSHYRTSTQNTKKHIRARLRDGYSVSDFKTVIDKKVKSWTGTKMEPYLRPDTLFGSKFESYLNEKTAAGGKAREPNRPTGNKFNNFEQRKYDFAELEKQLGG